jgi:LPS sulfotransferase NodH
MSAFTFEHPDTDASVAALFDAMVAAQSGNHDVRGMKLTTASEELARFFVEGVQAHLPSVRIVLLHRQDLVSQFGSLIKSQQTGVWRRRAGEEKTQSTPVLKLDRHDFAQYAIEAHQIRQKLQSLSNTHEILKISYEEVLLKDKLPTHDPLFKFVGVEPTRADWLADRKLSPPPETYIDNYDELAVMHDRIKRELKEGAAPEDLYSSYGRSLSGKLWRKASFWSRRPGYAMFRVEQRVRDAFGLSRVGENDRQ